MKRWRILAMLAILATAGTNLRAEGVSYDYFYTHLAPYGSWIQLTGYGYAFQPNVSAEWRPYANGYWASTDRGWLWVSFEDWGWATYHYGRWLYLKDRGWAWVPGSEWAPAWVSWRVGDGYIGWAPLPPGVAWNGGNDIELGMNFSDVGPYYYNFCPARLFASGNMTECILPIGENVQIMGTTQNVMHLAKVLQNDEIQIFNQGPNYASVSKLTPQPVMRLKVEQQKNPISPNGKISNTADGNIFYAFAPEFLPDGGIGNSPKSITETVAFSQMDDGYARIQDARQAQTLRHYIRQQVAEQERKQQATQGAQALIIEQRRAALQNQMNAAQSQPQAQQALRQNSQNALQEVQQLQQQQRIQQTLAAGAQSRIQSQQMDVQRLRQQAIVSDIPYRQVQALEMQTDIDRTLQQNRMNLLQQQNHNQLQQMQIILQQQQRPASR